MLRPTLRWANLSNGTAEERKRQNLLCVWENLRQTSPSFWQSNLLVKKREKHKTVNFKLRSWQNKTGYRLLWVQNWVSYQRKLLDHSPVVLLSLKTEILAFIFKSLKSFSRMFWRGFLEGHFIPRFLMLISFLFSANSLISPVAVIKLEVLTVKRIGRTK